MTQRAWRTVLLNDPCAYCGTTAKEVDHIVPHASGGENEWTNLAASCRRCNRQKKSKSLLTVLTGEQVGLNPAYDVVNTTAVFEAQCAALAQRKQQAERMRQIEELLAA